MRGLRSLHSNYESRLFGQCYRLIFIPVFNTKLTGLFPEIAFRRVNIIFYNAFLLSELKVC